MSKVFTVELNLDDDFSSSCAYHVDDFMTTAKRNIQHAETGHKTERWVIVALAQTFDEACGKAVPL